MHTFHLVVRSCMLMLFLSCGLPLYVITFMVGAHFWNSIRQLLSVDRGTTTKKGPNTFLY